MIYSFVPSIKCLELRARLSSPHTSLVSKQQAVTLGPLSQVSLKLEGLIGPFRTSPLGLVPKPHSSTFRLVQDWSFPRNDPDTQSVNSFINSDDFPTEWGTFSAASELILSLPPGCSSATFDISSAYRLVPVRPSQ